eukprot:scaffold2512_cov78-Skeletonema_dohrnii-CCMP3373.AAC.3
MGQDDDDDSSGNERNILSLHHGGRVLKGEKIFVQIMLEYNGDEDVQTWLEVVAQDALKYGHFYRQQIVLHSSLHLLKKMFVLVEACSSKFLCCSRSPSCPAKDLQAGNALRLLHSRIEVISTCIRVEDNHEDYNTEWIRLGNDMKPLSMEHGQEEGESGDDNMVAIESAVLKISLSSVRIIATKLITYGETISRLPSPHVTPSSSVGEPLSVPCSSSVASSSSLTSKREYSNVIPSVCWPMRLQLFHDGMSVKRGISSLEVQGKEGCALASSEGKVWGATEACVGVG